MQIAAPHLHLVAQPSAQSPAAGPLFGPGAPQRAVRPTRRPLGQILIEMGAVAPGDMLKAIALRDREDARLADILLTRGWVSEADLMAALALQWEARVVDVIAHPPDTRLLDSLGAAFCLAHGVLPWRRVGGAAVMTTARPEDFARARAALPAGFGPVIMALAPERDIHRALIATRQTALARRAETRVNDEESCRSQDGNSAAKRALVIASLCAAGLLVAPVAVFAFAAIWAIATLIATTGLKLACFSATLSAPQPRAMTWPRRLPVVSMMVPLFREDDIAPRLVRRLGRIDYPKELLDVLLVVEEDDLRTQAALGARSLPRWMRVVVVPAGPIRTKPRALNFALDFCRGSIVGIWDAEDAPDPGQIRTVVSRFHQAAPDVACLQGVLDFYNSRHNWLTRCFTVEYASWFRTLLPGLARLGLVVPLGGTTLFFRREMIEELGGWDAHNVTEDADLGLRLARRGYRTEIIDTVTEEEPNARPLAWIRQRSRWQKGFAMTWASHMRDPVRLWRELGPKRFLGVQILLIGTLSQAFLTPVLWSFWLLALGLPHPLSPMMPAGAIVVLCTLFVFAELVNITVGLWATRGPNHRHLMKWVPTLYVYSPLAALSSYKALYEWVTRPFYWDKTAHGAVRHVNGESPDLLPLLILTSPVYVPEETDPVALFPVRSVIASMPSRLNLRAPASASSEEDDATATGLPARPVLRVVPSSTGAGECTSAKRSDHVLGASFIETDRRPVLETQLSLTEF